MRCFIILVTSSSYSTSLLLNPNIKFNFFSQFSFVDFEMIEQITHRFVKMFIKLSSFIWKKKKIGISFYTTPHLEMMIESLLECIEKVTQVYILMKGQLYVSIPEEEVLYFLSVLIRWTHQIPSYQSKILTLLDYLFNEAEKLTFIFILFDRTSGTSRKTEKIISRCIPTIKLTVLIEASESWACHQMAVVTLISFVSSYLTSVCINNNPRYNNLW